MAIEWESVLNYVGALVSAILALISLILRSRNRKQTEEKTSEKIDRLSNMLKTASSEIDKLEEEVMNKSKKLKDLDETSKRLESLLSLKKEQVEAVRQEFRDTLKESNRSNKIWTVLMGAFWFLLGLFVRGFLGF